MQTDFNLQSYLQRIGYEGPVQPTLELLRTIHRLHLLAVPFENLDIHFGPPIYLDTAAFYEKIVNKNRGGFCYELNGLFSELLRRMGFRVKMLSAKVANPDRSWGPDFDHMTLLVNLEEPWIADVGFGDSFMEPLRLNEPGEQVQDGRRFRIVRGQDDALVYQAELEGNWLNQYLFNLQPHDLEDFSEMCRYQQTSPKSSFTQKVVCSLATQDGRITLTNERLIVTSQGVRQESNLSGKDEFHALLRKHFGIVLDHLADLGHVDNSNL